MNMQAKMLVGDGSRKESSLQQFETFNRGPIESRIAYIIMANELAGTDKALTELDKLEKAVSEATEKEVARNKEVETFDDDLQSDDETEETKKATAVSANAQTTETEFEFSDEQLELLQLTRDLITEYAAENFDTAHISDQQRKLLSDRLGWIGQLALYPRDTKDTDARDGLLEKTNKVTVLLVVIVCLAILAFLVGLIAMFTMVGLLYMRQLDWKFQDCTPHGFVYIETFAVWLVLFMGLQLMGGILGGLTGNISLAMLLGPAAFFGSLLALIWPVFRGVSWKRVRQDIGLELRNPFIEMGAGIFSYLAMLLPFICGIASIGILTTLFDSFFPAGEFESTTSVGHPISEEISAGGPLMYFVVVVSACVAAPIVEEIMFRGVLYRYLRDATSGASARWISVLASSIFGGILFAAIHPQGVAAIPALTILAMGFSFAREWRNSLIGPMVMHAVHNGILTTFMLLMLT
jgi:membrane protease YdiL (CAAX protease family)